MKKGSGKYDNYPIEFFVSNDMKISEDEQFLNITSDHIPKVKDYYMISNYGRVYNKYLDKFIYQSKDKNTGYISSKFSTSIKSKGSSKTIHRLMMRVFNPISNDQTLVVNHKNGIKTDNRLENLEWTTKSGNMQHAVRTGLCKIGENHPGAVMNSQKVREICSLLENTDKTLKQIGVETGVSTHNVESLLYNGNWVEITSEYNIHRDRKHKKHI